jgi:biotin carboxylase
MFRTYCNKSQYILLLKADEFLRDRSILAALRNYDGMVVGMSKIPALSPIRFFDHILTGDPHRPDDVVQSVRDFEKQYNLVPKAVIPITEMVLQSAFAVANEYKIPFLNEECVKASRNKILMKEAFTKHNISTPKYLPFSTIEELRSNSDKLGYPVIVKPTMAAHSVGIRKIQCSDEIESCFNYCREGLSSISSAWFLEEGLFQVEEFIEADEELSVEVINYLGNHQIIAITDKYLTPPPYFAEVGHMVPSKHSNNELVRNLALNACQALGISYGISHVEIRIAQDGKPYVIEVASRPGGDGIMDLVERSYGVNLYDLHIRSYLGTLDKEQLWNLNLLGTAAVAFLPGKVGTVKSMSLPQQLPKEVVGLYLSAKPGDEVGKTLNYDDRMGTVEFFWDSQVDGLSNRHLDLAKQLREEIYTFE